MLHYIFQMSSNVTSGSGKVHLGKNMNGGSGEVNSGKTMDGRRRTGDKNAVVGVQVAACDRSCGPCLMLLNDVLASAPCTALQSWLFSDAVAAL